MSRQAFYLRWNACFMLCCHCHQRGFEHARQFGDAL